MVLISFLSFFDLGKTCEWQLVLLKDWIKKGVRLSLKKIRLVLFKIISRRVSRFSEEINA